jgi:putative addiction module component (TIGR02574 family)
MARPAVDIDQLTVGERFALIEQLWDSLRGRASGFPMSAEEREVIEARRVAHRSDPSTAIAWDSVRAELAADQDADDQVGPSGSRPRG